jgi:hypothetical protein
MSPKSLIGLLALVACGTSSDLERICRVATECGVIAAAETATCIDELDAAAPDSATRATAECADCLDSTTCGEIDSGDCSEACEPLNDAIADVEGTVSGSCNTIQRGNRAFKGDSSLVIELICETGGATFIRPGPMSSVGETKACGSYRNLLAGVDCPQANGTVTIVQKDGRRWLTGSCACAGLFVQFDVPYIIGI